MYQAAAILEGGGMRGTYTTGVIDAFLEYDIEFSAVYGVSAGACHGSSFVSKQHGRAFRLSYEYLHDKNYCGLYSLLTTGNLFGVEMLFHRFHHELDPYDFEAFERYTGEFVVVATALQTGEAVYHRMTFDEMKYRMLFIQASSSMPMVSKNVEIDGALYLDGCIGDSIPVRQSIADGHAKNVVVLTRPRGYRKGENKLMPLIQRRYREFPNFVARCADRHVRYNATLDFIDAEEKARRLFVIAPSSEPKVGSVTKSKRKLLDLYHMGYEDTIERMDALLRYLDE